MKFRAIEVVKLVSIVAALSVNAVVANEADEHVKCAGITATDPAAKKGEGWVEVSSQECTEKGGTVVQ